MGETVWVFCLFLKNAYFLHFFHRVRFFYVEKNQRGKSKYSPKDSIRAQKHLFSYITLFFHDIPLILGCD